MKFEFYYELYFWLFFAIIVFLFRTLRFNIKTKCVFLLTVNTGMLFFLPKFNLLMLVFLLIISTAVYFAGYYLNEKTFNIDKSHRIFIGFALISILTFILLIFKYEKLQKVLYLTLHKSGSAAYKYIFVIGISYFTFKLIHYIIECYKQKIPKPDYLIFLNYIMFFPSFISGPINRYNHFSSELESGKDNPASDVKDGSMRIINGLFKKFVLCTIVMPYALLNIKKPLGDITAIEMTFSLYATTLYYYFDFSSYSDMAIGSGRIMGIELPENFNLPLLKKNIQLLWANWHMSLTKFLTDYIYWPLSRKLRQLEYFKKHPIVLSNISIVVTFAVCGIWHGPTLNFFIWGVYHGVGLSLLNTYHYKKRNVKNITLRRYFSSRLSEIVGIIATFNFFSFGILFFSLNMSKLHGLFVGMFGLAR